MSAISVGSRSNLMVQSLVQMRSQLDDLNRQLGTGQKSTTYAGLGLDRGLSVALNANLSAIGGYADTITNVSTRLQLAQTTLGRMSDIAGEASAAVTKNTFDPDATGQTSSGKAALTSLNEYVSLLNSQVGDRYMFSGSATDTPAVDSMDHILNGNGAQAGLKQVISERNQADLGANGLGRLVISQPSATSVGIAEDAASPFGFKLSSASTTIAGATVSAPSGSPASASVDLGTSNANTGDTVTFQLKLPDGTTENVVLTATANNPPAANQFTIGASPSDTAANIQTALTTSVGTLASTSLSAASAIAASNDFFNPDSSHPPQRVDGPPFDTATALKDGTSADTVSWYTGEAGTGSARATAQARIDTSINVSYGMRATEQGIRGVLQNLAVQASVTYSSTDPNAAARNLALGQRLTANYSGSSGAGGIQSIEVDLAGSQSSLQATTDRHTQTAATLQDLQQQITGVSNEQVGSQILALQTRLEASLQTTAKVYQISLVNYLS
jgi:flagellin-like hook-associated protein FlgL